MWNAHHSISASEEESPPNRDVHRQRKEIRALRTAYSAAIIPTASRATVVLDSEGDDAAADITEAYQSAG